MTPTPISTLLIDRPDGPAPAFDPAGRRIEWDTILQRTCGIRDALADTPGQRWAVRADDSVEFVAALLGVWLARHIPVLVPSDSHLTTWRDRLALDGVVARDATTGLPHVPLVGDAAPVAGELRIPPDSRFLIFTSGSSGEPKAIEKALTHLQAEIEVLESLWGDGHAGRVFSTVSHHHMYGLLFRLLWPLTTGRPFASTMLDYPEQLVAAAADDATLVASPAVLKRIDGLAPARPGWRRVFSSGGLLPPESARAAHAVLGSAPIEVLGSTETGGVAWRVQAEATDWHALPEVRIRQGDEGFLEVSSPFTGHSHWFRMGDRVTVVDSRRFELHGRGDRVAKVEDKRVSLVEIEDAVSASPLVAECAAAVVDDGGREIIGVVVVLTDAGRAVLERSGRAELTKGLRAQVHGRFEPVVTPRRFRYVRALPADTQGKREQAAVARLLASRP